MSKFTKVIAAVIVILAACSLITGTVIFRAGNLFSSSPESSMHYFLTVSEVLKKKDNILDRPIRISGAVIGDSIEFDEGSRKLSFLIADIPADNDQIAQEGGLAVALENAVNDPVRQRINIVYAGEKPELLRNQAQAIMIGELHSDGIFYADEILLKCPSRYEEALPHQAID